jgi:hypothetical protein
VRGIHLTFASASSVWRREPDFVYLDSEARQLDWRDIETGCIVAGPTSRVDLGRHDHRFLDRGVAALPHISVATRGRST